MEYALKAAVADPEQLRDRCRALRRSNLPLRLELHTFGERDVDTRTARQASLTNIRRLQDEQGHVELTVHVPVQVVARVTEDDFDEVQVEHAIELASLLSAPQIVVHRYWGLVYGDAPPRANREEAVAAFNETIAKLARLAPETTLLVENVGYYSLLPRTRDAFLHGPLNHFFPWEIEEFRTFLSTERLTNVEPFVDVAHATLSSNLFNWRRDHFAATRDDTRFSGILDTDLDHANELHPFDFVDPAMPWLHVSDSRYYDAYERQSPSIPLDALTSEGLEIGSGNLPWSFFRERAEVDASTVVVVEVDPGRNDTHVRNDAQYRSLDRLAEELGPAVPS